MSDLATILQNLKEEPNVHDVKLTSVENLAKRYVNTRARLLAVVACLETLANAYYANERKGADLFSITEKLAAALEEGNKRNE